MKSVTTRIETFNAGRNPELLKRKYALMREDVFSFFRGTCHLFYEDWPRKTPLNKAPAVWLSGDLHLENFGSYRGDNRLVYFDINDFDEAVLGPCTWDVTRLVTSILVGDNALAVTDVQAAQLSKELIDAYARTLAKGAVHGIERATSTGLIHTLLYSLKERTHKKFLDQHTVKHGKERRLSIDNVHTMALTSEDHEHIKTLIENWATEQDDPHFMSVIDIVRHAAGTGSLGLENYLLLVEGEGSPRKNFLLTLKEEQRSSLAPYVVAAQPKWSNEAERVIASQKRLQATPSSRLRVVDTPERAYILREYQPDDDRIMLNSWHGKYERIEQLMITLGEITAWDHLRSTGRKGSAIADDLIEFGQRSDWQVELLDYARNYAAQVKADYTSFRNEDREDEEGKSPAKVIKPPMKATPKATGATKAPKQARPVIKKVAVPEKT